MEAKEVFQRLYIYKGEERGGVEGTVAQGRVGIKAAVGTAKQKGKTLHL